jgi:IclR family acetate operon transcriptional repressor
MRHVMLQQAQGSGFAHADTLAREMNADATNGERPRIQSVARALAMLLDVAQEDGGLTVRELADRQGLRLPTTYHLVHTLISEGFLVRGEGRRLRLGLHAATLGSGFDWQSVPQLTLAPIMRRLADETGETIYVAAWRDGGAELLAIVSGRHPITVSDVRPGPAPHAHARASGKALLAHLPEAARDAYLATHALVRRTPRTLVDRADLERELQTIRSQGYATDLEEYELGVCCLSAPLEEGRSAFIVALSAPKERFLENFESYRDAVLAAARQPIG